MSQGDGDRMTREYFELLDQILEARDLSGREVSGHIDRSPPFYSRLKKRQDLGRSWEVVERGLGISPRNLLAILTKDVKYDEMLAAFGPQDDPKEPAFLSDLRRLEKRIAMSIIGQQAEFEGEAEKALEDLELRRFQNADAVEAECRRIVLGAVEADALRRDEAVIAVGALGVWSTIRRHVNDRGSATQGLVTAIRASSTLGIDRLAARLLRRATYLLCDVDQFRAADLAAQRAVDIYLDLSDRTGLGMAFIDTGFIAYGCRELDRSEARLLLGADLLGSSPLDHIYKASAYQLAARSCTVRRQLSKAYQHLEKAARFASAHEQHWAAIRWCTGNIQFQLGLLEEAEHSLREALRSYLRTSKIGDIVMLLLDLSTVLYAGDRGHEIPTLAAHLQPILEGLSEKGQIRHHVEEAHACLIRARHRQTLSRFKKGYEKVWRQGIATP